MSARAQVSPGSAAATHAAAAEGTGALAHRRMGLALPLIAAAQLMVILDARILNVALPHIQQALGFTGSELQWVDKTLFRNAGGASHEGGGLPQATGSC